MGNGHTVATTAFWACAALVAYAYIGYPLLVWFLAQVKGRPVRRGVAPAPSSVSIVVTAYNEEAIIGRRVRELRDLLAATGLHGEVIVVSDGSTDRTAEIARAHEGDNVRVLDLPLNVGKAAALSEGVAVARHEIVTFADARQSWTADSLRFLVESFDDPAVGAVSGDLVIESRPGVMAGVGLYWRYEKWIRRQETALHSSVGVSGSISAVRRALFCPIPPGTVLDDVYWPMRVVMRGFRVVHNARAQAFDRPPARVRDEFRRKVRTLSGNYQLLLQIPDALLPWRNPIWFQFLSHKILRLLVPWALLIMLASSAMLPETIHRVAFRLQVAFYLLGLVGIWSEIGSRIRMASAAASLLVLNAAAWLAFWVWASGSTTRSWRKALYRSVK